MFDSLPDLPVERRWRGQTSPVPTVIALIHRAIIDDGISDGAAAEGVTHYLLIKRQDEPYIGKWALVGGRWEFGETVDRAITREVQEETGLEATFVALRGVVNERIVSRSLDVSAGHYQLFVCELAAPTGEAREQSEGPVAWFTVDELEALSAEQQIIANDYTILRHFSRRHFGRRHFSDQDSPLAYVEVEVVVGGKDAPDELVRFEVR